MRVKANLANNVTLAFCCIAAGLISLPVQAGGQPYCDAPELAREFTKIQDQRAKCTQNSALAFCDDAEGYQPELGMKRSGEIWACLKQNVLPDVFAGRGSIAEGAYRDWQRYSTVPYASAHVNRFVKNVDDKAIYVMSFANEKGKNYGLAEKAGVLPEGSVLAKFSLLVSAEGGRIDPAPLFIMEKLKHGSRPQSMDWRYSMVIPDGQGDLFSNAKFTEQLCMDCHKEYAAETDSVFFVPEDYRISP